MVPSPIRTPAQLALFVVALESLDLFHAAREQVAREGLMVVTPRSGVPHCHPLLKVIETSRKSFTAVWRQLQLGYHNGTATASADDLALLLGHTATTADE